MFLTCPPLTLGEQPELYGQLAAVHDPLPMESSCFEVWKNSERLQNRPVSHAVDSYPSDEGKCEV